MYLLVEEFSNCFDYFLRLSGPSRCPDLFGKVVLITLKFLNNFFARAMEVKLI